MLSPTINVLLFLWFDSVHAFIALQGSKKKIRLRQCQAPPSLFVNNFQMRPLGHHSENWVKSVTVTRLLIPGWSTELVPGLYWENLSSKTKNQKNNRKQNKQTNLGSDAINLLTLYTVVTQHKRCQSGKWPLSSLCLRKHASTGAVKNAKMAPP